MRFNRDKIKAFLKRNFFAVTVLVVFLIFLMVISLYLSKFHSGLSGKQDTWGQFGDFVGGTLNPILGFLTVMILVSTLRVQQKELKDAREAVKENGRLIASQVELMEQQALENTFFKLLDDFSKDPLLNKCKAPGKVAAIFFALYKIKNMPVDSKEASAIFFEMVEELSLGEFRYIVIEKMLILTTVALKLKNKNLHLKLLQTTVGVALASCIVHHSKVITIHFNVFKEGKEILRGVSSKFVYDNEVAAAFMPGEDFAKYLERKVSIIEKLEEAIELFVNEKKRGSEGPL